MDRCLKEQLPMRRRQVPLVVQDHRSKRGAIVQQDLLDKLEHKV